MEGRTAVFDVFAADMSSLDLEGVRLDGHDGFNQPVSPFLLSRLDGRLTYPARQPFSWVTHLTTLET